MAERGTEPVFLRPSAHPALWGVENWEISNHDSDISIVEGGRFDGRSLREIAPDFPLIVKTIHADKLLSVQVHPGETTCRETGGDPKSELWYALSDGYVYAGFKPGTSREDVKEAMRAKRLEELLVRHDVSVGDVLYIPAGMVHSIGGGTVLYEVQQSSDTTFRFYDWDRVDENGNSRQLHVDAAFKAIDCSLPPPVKCKALKTPYFDFSQMNLSGETEVDSGSYCLVFYVASGRISLDGRIVESGENFLLLPNTKTMFCGDDAVLLKTVVESP